LTAPFLPGFRDVFEAVHNGAGDYGVVPVENSDAGSVSEVYDLILKHREIRTALHEGLVLREHLFDRTRPLCAAQAVAHGNIRRTDDEHAVLHDEVIDLRDKYGDSAVALYSAIMSISRARQHNMLKSGGVLRNLEQNSPKTLKADPRVICQGGIK